MEPTNDYNFFTFRSEKQTKTNFCLVLCSLISTFVENIVNHGQLLVKYTKSQDQETAGTPAEIGPSPRNRTVRCRGTTRDPATCFVSPHVYERIAYRESTEGVIAVVHTRNRTLDELSFKDNPLLIVLERVEKPGNLGAIMRSADAAGADAVIVCDPLTDLFNPNLIRASLGAVFSVPCVVCTSEDCIRYLKEHHIRILTAQLQDASLYYDTDMIGPTAIVMGTESTGLTTSWREAADAHIRIPMNGRLDSLNVSVSAAVLLYEAVRQRLTSTGCSRSSSTMPPQ